MATKNIFAELGFENDEATVEAWRTDLARIIRACFERGQMSQVAFSRRLGIKQSVVSRIINGRVGSLSVEFLLRLCVRLGTRGLAHWGPNPDEALVTTDLVSVTGTETSVTNVPTLNVGAPLPRLARRGAGSQSSTARLH
jgi:predicted XRE-type DNA-binding protein